MDNEKIESVEFISFFWLFWGAVTGALIIFFVGGIPKSEGEKIIAVIGILAMAIVTGITQRKARLTIKIAPDSLTRIRKMLVVEWGFTPVGKTGNLEVFKRKMNRLTLSEESDHIEIIGLKPDLEKVKKIFFCGQTE